MKIAILAGAGFIGTNLALYLSKDEQNNITVVDEKEDYFHDDLSISNIDKCVMSFNENTDFNEVLKGKDIVYHLISTNNPTSSNNNIGREIIDNIAITINILEACVKQNIKKIIFLSSGGTVYGNPLEYPIKEDTVENPITTYGIQKLTIEKLLYLYNYVHKLNYSIIRLSNPYGPYQRPNGKLGVITTFVYKALKGEKLVVYGDGSVVRDYIFISDAVEGIVRIASSCTEEKIFNLGSGIGTSVNNIISTIRKILNNNIEVEYIEKRAVDVPVNYLDMSKYKKEIEQLDLVSLEDGIVKTIEYFRENNL